MNFLDKNDLDQILKEIGAAKQSIRQAMLANHETITAQQMAELYDAKSLLERAETIVSCVDESDPASYPDAIEQGESSGRMEIL